MFHFKESIQNTKGDALIGYFVRLANTSDDSGITLYADSSLTPIVSVSGLADAAKVDSDGMADFWVPSGTYHMDIYATDGATLVRRETYMQMGVPSGDYGDVTVAEGDAWTVDAVSGTAPSSIGLAVLSAADQAAARTAIGAGVGGGDLVSTNNLSDVANTTTALSNIGGQPLDATLTALAGLAYTSGTLVPALTAADTFALKTVGSSTGNILDKAAGDALYQSKDATLAAAAALAWSGGTQVLTLTGTDTFTLKTVGAASGNILDKAAGDSLYGPATPGASWALISTYDFGTQAAAGNVNFTGLGSYNEILIQIVAVGCSASANRVVRVSTDNGTSFYSASGNYKKLSSAGTVSNQGSAAFTGTPSTAALYLSCQIRNTKGAVKFCLSDQGNVFFDADTADINAVQVTSDGAGNLNSGKIYVYGR